jgi:hypothetical protein
MIFGAELGMIVLGIVTLATGRLTFSKKRVVNGPLARRLSIVLFLPIPFAYVAHGFLHASFVTRGKPVGNSSTFYWTMVAIEAAIVILCMAIVYGIGWTRATDPTADKKILEGEPPAPSGFGG